MAATPERTRHKWESELQALRKKLEDTEAAAMYEVERAEQAVEAVTSEGGSNRQRWAKEKDELQS